MTAILPRAPGHEAQAQHVQERVLEYVRTHPGATTRQVADDVLLNRTRDAYNRIQTVLLRLSSQAVVRRDIHVKPHAWYVLDDAREEDRVLLQRCVELVVRLAHHSDDTVEWMRLLRDVERAGVQLPPEPGGRRPVALGALAQRLGHIGARAASIIASRATGT